MKKLLILTLVLCFMASALFATQTRVLTMGGANGIVKDDANIWMYPSLLYDHPDMVIGEFGYSAWDYGRDNIWNPFISFDIEEYDEYNEFTDMGIHYKFGEDNPFVLGIYFTNNQPNYMFPYWIAFPYAEGNDVYFYGNDRLDLFYARMLGENKFGFHFAYLKESYKFEAGGSDLYDVGTTGYGFGFGLTAMENKLDVSAQVALFSWKYFDDDLDEEDVTEPDGNMVIMLNGRYWHEMNQKCTVIPHMEFEYAKVGAKYNEDVSFDDDWATREDKFMAIDAGVGLNYTPAAGILAIGDLGVRYHKEDYSETYTDDTDYGEKWSTFVLPYFRIGLDAVVFDWMDLRMGAASFWYGDSYEVEEVDAKSTGSYVETYTFLGAGFHWGNLYIDTYMDPGILLDGFEFIRGNNGDYEDWDDDEYRRMNYQVTVKYNMF